LCAFTKSWTWLPRCKLPPRTARQAQRQDFGFIRPLPPHFVVMLKTRNENEQRFHAGAISSENTH
jgi:hypothetical protein